MKVIHHDWALCSKARRYSCLNAMHLSFLSHVLTLVAMNLCNEEFFSGKLCHPLQSLFFPTMLDCVRSV